MRPAMLLAVVALGCGGEGIREPPDPCATSLEQGAPADLRCTGLYEDWGDRRVAWTARPYAPGTPLWSDGAGKRRWISLPPALIDVSDPDEWVFPVGTKVWKEFSLGDRPIETRYFAKVADDRWQRATYVWSDDETEAVRKDRGTPDFQGTGYTIPSTEDCDKCHDGRRDRLLGVEAISLDQPSSAGLTLADLIHERRLDPLDPAAAPMLAHLPSPTREALLWMHVNCGVSCHNPSADATTASSTGLFLRLEAAQLARSATEGISVLDPIRTTVGVPTVTAKWGGTVRIVPGDPASSFLYHLAASRGAEQMPPGSRLVDPEGEQVLRAWISSLAP